MAKYDPDWCVGLWDKWSAGYDTLVFGGIDPSLTATGLALIAIKRGSDSIVDIATTTIDCPSGRYTETERASRIRWIIDGSFGFNMAGVAMEDMPRNAMSAGLTAQAHGIVKSSLDIAGIGRQVEDPRLIALAPATLKKYHTGDGRATKEKMIASSKMLASPWCEIEDDNQADALALAWASMDHYLGGLQNTKYKDLGSIQVDRQVLIH